MDDMRISCDNDGKHYEHEMHEVSGEKLRQYILAHPNEDFQSCVMMCGELVNMYPLESTAYGTDCRGGCEP